MERDCGPQAFLGAAVIAIGQSQQTVEHSTQHICRARPCCFSPSLQLMANPASLVHLSLETQGAPFRVQEKRDDGRRECCLFYALKYQREVTEGDGVLALSGIG